MAKHSFGAPVEDDILEIQGKEYRLQPFGMRAFKGSLERSKEADKIRTMEGTERTESTYALSVDLIVNAVHPDDQERVAQHIEDSVPPVLVSQIAAAIMRGLTDVDPTQPTSSSDGSSETGDDSTDGASDEESTPST
jgi:hypothetical protein